jgi:hypothetical protein
LKLADEVIDVDVSRADGAKGDDVRVMIVRDVSHREGLFVDIHPDGQCARLAHG